MVKIAVYNSPILVFDSVLRINSLNSRVEIEDENEPLITESNTTTTSNTK